MTITIQSVQIGQLITAGDPHESDPMLRRWTTGFYKVPVDGLVKVTRLGLQGDAVGDTRNHGGIDKAILCYAAAHYEQWAIEYPELQMSAGAMAENLTIAGADETNICIGDRFRVGSCELEVSQPRQPCWKIARRWGVKTMTNVVTQTGRTGWYVRVIRTGMLESGQPLELIARPYPDWSVARANNVMFGREVNRLSAFELMNLQELAEAWRADIA